LEEAKPVEAKAEGEGKKDEKAGDKPAEEAPKVDEIPEPVTQEDKIKDATDGKVFVNAPKGGKDLEAIKPKFEALGMNVYETGKTGTKMEETVYNAIKAEIAAAQEAKKKDGEGKAVKKTSGGLFGSVTRAGIAWVLISISMLNGF